MFKIFGVNFLKTRNFVMARLYLKAPIIILCKFFIPVNNETDFPKYYQALVEGPSRKERKCHTLRVFIVDVFC